MFSWGSPRQGPLVVAHRGSSDSAPENTLAAFSRAVADGADAFELDARITSDRKVVVFHDQTLARTAGGRGRVSDTTAASIRGLSAGAWFSEEFADERVPLLEEALHIAGGGTGVNIELKFDSRREHPGPLVRRVRDIVRGFRHRESLLVSSFHHGALALLRSVAPDIDTGILVYPPGVPTTSGVRLARRIGALYLIYSGGNIRESFVVRARMEGLRTLEYTVNGPVRLKRALKFGLDGVITNDPAWIRELIGTGRGRR
jgi:glycerophosphoryl diester phosphodiesterase